MMPKQKVTDWLTANKLSLFSKTKNILSQINSFEINVNGNRIEGALSYKYWWKTDMERELWTVVLY